jgi:hypothetical protein
VFHSESVIFRFIWRRKNTDILFHIAHAGDF